MVDPPPGALLEDRVWTYGVSQRRAGRGCTTGWPLIVRPDAMSVDSLEPCGIYFGTTGGQVYASADSGDRWKAIVHDLPAVLSVEVQTLK